MKLSKRGLKAAAWFIAVIILVMAIVFGLIELIGWIVDKAGFNVAFFIGVTFALLVAAVGVYLSVASDENEPKH